MDKRLKVESFWISWWQTNFTNTVRFTLMKQTKSSTDYHSCQTNIKTETSWTVSEFQQILSRYNFRNTSTKWLRFHLSLETFLPWEDSWLTAYKKTRKAWISSFLVKETRQLIPMGFSLTLWKQVHLITTE